MREILFRGKKHDGDWVQGGILQTEENPIIFTMIDYEGNDFEPPSSEVVEIEVILETVGQYTGLKDKNGTKIFEGDVVKIGSDIIDWKCYHEVIFEEGQWFYLHKTPFAKSYMGAWGNSCVEVIGNIYDNPELLGGVNNEAN